MKHVHEVRMPDIGDAKDVGVIEILVKAGDAVLEGQTLIIVETDKASMEIPSPQTGVLQSLTVGLDDKISEGSPIALIESEGRSPAPAPLIEPVAALAEPRQEVSAPSLIEVREPPTDSPLASPSVRQFSRELGVSLINSPQSPFWGWVKAGNGSRWKRGRVATRYILPLSLSWDHRVIDGAAAGRFNAYLGSVLADYRRLVL